MAEITKNPQLVSLGSAPTAEAPHALKPTVDERSLTYRQLATGTFWHKIPAYASVSEAEFLDHKWQSKHTITNPDKLLAALKGLASDDFLRDATAGFQKAPMSVRVSPYLMSLID